MSAHGLETQFLRLFTAMGRGYFIDVAVDNLTKRCSLSLGSTDENAPYHLRFNDSSPSFRLGLGIEGFSLFREALLANLDFPLIFTTLADRSHFSLPVLCHNCIVA